MVSRRAGSTADVLVLPDILAPGLRLVVVGTAVGECSFRRGHHYSGRGDSFWELLHESGLTARRLGPQEDAGLPAYGIGLASVVNVGGATFDVDGLVRVLECCRPAWVAFNGKVAATAVARAQGRPRPGLGLQPWRVAGAEVFVLPSSSGANRRSSYDGRPARLDWWTDLGALVGSPVPTPAREGISGAGRA